MYIIQNSSMDFPDAAQRFSWCNCQGDTRKKLGLAGLGQDTPIFDFNFWSNQLSGGGSPTTTPAAASSTMFSTLVPQLPGGGSWLIPGLAIAGLAYFMFRGKGGRRRR